MVLQQIIVVDNNPAPDSKVSAICRSYPNITLVHEPRQGPSFARNRGLKEAKGEFISFIDEDVVLTPDWLSEAMKYFDYPWIDVVQPTVIPVGSGEMLEFRKKFISSKTLGTFNYLNLAKLALPHINTASIIVRASALNPQISFDEALLRCEDTDFGLKLFFTGSHFAVAEKAVAHVYDDRNHLSYLKRSFSNGYYLGQLKKLWDDPTSGRWSLSFSRIFSSGDFLQSIHYVFSLMGEIKGFLSSNFPADRRSKFLRSKKKNLVDFPVPLNPWMRIVLLKNEMVIYNLQDDSKKILTGKSMEKLISASGRDK